MYSYMKWNPWVVSSGVGWPKNKDQYLASHDSLESNIRVQH